MATGSGGVLAAEPASDRPPTTSQVRPSLAWQQNSQFMQGVYQRLAFGHGVFEHHMFQSLLGHSGP